MPYVVVVVIVVVVVVEAVVVVVVVAVVALLNLKCLNQGDAAEKARGPCLPLLCGPSSLFFPMD